MSALGWIVFAFVCAFLAFGSDNKPKNSQPEDNNNSNNNNNDDDDNDGLVDGIVMFGMMDYVSDGELDGNFSDEY